MRLIRAALRRFGSNLQIFRNSCNNLNCSKQTFEVPKTWYSTCPDGMKVCIVGAAGCTGRPLDQLLKQCPQLDEIALYDICANCQQDMELNHGDTNGEVTSNSGSHMLTDALKFTGELPAVPYLNMLLCTTAPTKPPYSLTRITLEDKDKVLKFLRRFFFRDEPLNMAAKLLETPDFRCPEMEDYTLSFLKDKVSVAAVLKNGNYAGIAINHITKKKEGDCDHKSQKYKNPNFQRVLKVLGYLDREAKIFDKLPKDCDTVVQVKIVSIHSEWRGRGLMKVLCKESERIACEIGAGAMRMDATSAFSAAAAERLKYTKIYSKLYKDIPDAPQPPPPHLEGRVYIKPL